MKNMVIIIVMLSLSICMVINNCTSGGDNDDNNDPQWLDQVEIEKTIWSEDDEKQAFIIHYFQEKEGEIREHKKYIYIQNADGSGQESVLGPVENDFGPQFYYMNAFGYIIYETVVGSEHTFYILRLEDSSSETLGSYDDTASCASFEITPSPGGSVIAKMSRGGTCEAGAATVNYYNSIDMALRYSLSFPVVDTIDSTWTTSQTFHVRQEDGSSWRIDEDDGAVSEAEPNCLYPKTTSSDISAAGIRIGPGDSLDNPVSTLDTVSVPFGCQ